MDTSSERKYDVTWSTTETFYYRSTVDAETMADMIGVSVRELEACGDDPRCINNLEGMRGLENGLADIEDDDTEDPEHSNDLEREVESVRIVHV